MPPLEDRIVIAGRSWRKGYTTGSCAAAAAKAATAMLLSGVDLDLVEIDVPAGKRLVLEVRDVRRQDGEVACSVIKDAGDDPDVTDGMRIFAVASRKPEPGLTIEAGEGIGTVTLPGLKVAVGRPAINPVPLKMIRREVEALLSPNEGIRIRLSIPGGAEVARRTFNPRLGIVGGLSILGTSGIVNPMSEEAWKEALALELGILASRGSRRAVFTFGNQGEQFARSACGLPETDIVTVGNFVGYMLDEATRLGFGEILFAGHLGKLIKVAAGIFHTHSRVADARMEILAAYAALEGAERATVEAIFGCATTDAACDLIDRKGLSAVYARIASAASRRCAQHSWGKLRCGTVLYRGTDSFLAMDDEAAAMIDAWGRNG